MTLMIAQDMAPNMVDAGVGGAPCAVLLLGVMVFLGVVWDVRSRDVNRRYGKLRKRLAKIKAEIDYLEERGIEKAGMLDTPLKDLRVERAAIEEELKLIEEARKRAGTTRICADANCRHENAADAKHCAKCGSELV